MPFTYAGQWGPDSITTRGGAPLSNLPVTINVHGDGLATLYTDRTKATTAPNPTVTDALGNLTFFADPGDYDIVGNGDTITVSVGTDPSEGGGGGAPSGPAGGDLTGTYPNPTLHTAGPGATGPIGDSTDIPVITIDAKGRVTGLTSVAAAGGPPTGSAGGDLSGTYPNPNLKNTGPGATGPIGDGTHVSTVTIDAQGRVTGLTSTAITAGGAGTVTSVPDFSANGFAGTWATRTSTPALTMTTSVTGVLKGNGTAISAAAAADIPTVAQGSTGPLSATDATLTNSRAPNGSASGDLSASYPNPTVAKILGLAPAVLAAVQACPVANVNIASPGSVFDGYTLSNSGSDRLLLGPSQTTGSQRGVWVWNGAASPLTRPTDFASGAVITSPKIVFVASGSSYGATWLSLNATASSPITVDTTAQSWPQVSAPPMGGAAGDLTGAYPSPTLAAAGPGATGPIGSATVVPVVTIDAKGRVTGLTSTTITGTAPGGSASGDLSGSYPGPNVAKINGTSMAGLTTGILKNTTGTGVPSIAAAADIPTVGAGSTGPLSATDGSVTNSRAPNGSASGDLTGSYPSPTLAAAGPGATGPIGSATVVPVVTIDAKGRTTALSSTTITGVVPGGSASGDLTGSYPGPTLAAAGPGATGPIGSASVTPVVTIDAKGRVTGLTSAYMGRTPFYVVAASNSAAAWKNGADAVCSGTNDHTTINAALTAAAGGTVLLVAGTYNVAAPIIMPSTGNTELCGQGKGTIISPTFPLTVQQTLTCDLTAGTSSIVLHAGGNFPAGMDGMLVLDTTTPANIPAGTILLTRPTNVATLTLSNAPTTSTSQVLTFSNKTVWPVIDVYDQSASGTNPVSGCHIHDFAIAYAGVGYQAGGIVAGVTQGGLPGGSRGLGGIEVGIYVNGNYNTVENIYTESINTTCTNDAWNRSGAWMTSTNDGVATGAGTVASVTLTAGSTTATVAGTGFSPIFQGMEVRAGQSLSPSTTVAQVAATLNSLTLSQPALASGTVTLTYDGLPVVASLTQGWTSPANVGDAVYVEGAGTYTPPGHTASLVGYVAQVLTPSNVTSCTVTNASNSVTVASGGFPGVRAGMLVTDVTTGAHISANTKVLNVNGNTLLLSANAAGSGTDTLAFNGVLLDTPGSFTTASVTAALIVTAKCGPGLGRAMSNTFRNITCKNGWVGINGGNSEQTHIDGLHGNFIDQPGAPAHSIYFGSRYGADHIDLYVNDVDFYQGAGGRTGNGYCVKIAGVVGGRFSNCSARGSGVLGDEGPLRHVSFSDFTGTQQTNYPVGMLGFEQYCNYLNFDIDLDPGVVAPIAVQLGGNNNRFSQMSVTTNHVADRLSDFVIYDMGQWNDYDGVEVIAQAGRHNGFYLSGPGGHSVKNVNGQHLVNLAGSISGNIYRTRMFYDPAASSDISGTTMCAINGSASAFPCYIPADDVTPVNISGTGTWTPDLTLTNTYVLNITTTAAVTIANPSAIAKGNKLRLIIENNNATSAANPLALTWGTQYGFVTKWVSPAPGQRAVIEFVSPQDTPAAGGFIESYRNAVGPPPSADYAPGVLAGTSLWYPLHDYQGPLSAASLMTVGTAYIVPKFISQPCTLTGFAVNVTTLGTTPVYHFNVYADDGSGSNPANAVPLIATDATASPGATGMISSSAVSQPLQRGWYWFAVAVATGTGPCDLEGTTGGRPNILTTGAPSLSQSTNPANCYSITGQTGATMGAFSSGARHGPSQVAPLMWLNLT